MRTKYFQEDENQQNSPKDTQNKVESKLLGKCYFKHTDQVPFLCDLRFNVHFTAPLLRLLFCFENNSILQQINAPGNT